MAVVRAMLMAVTRAMLMAVARAMLMVVARAMLMVVTRAMLMAVARAMLMAVARAMLMVATLAAAVEIVAKEAVPEAASLPPRSSARQRSRAPQSHTQTRLYPSIHRHCGSTHQLRRSGLDRRRRFGSHPSSLCLGWGSLVGAAETVAAAVAVQVVLPVLVEARVATEAVPEAASLPPRSSARQRSRAPQSHTQTRSYPSIHHHCGNTHQWHHNGLDRRRRFGSQASSLCLGWGSLVGAAEAMEVTVVAVVNAVALLPRRSSARQRSRAPQSHTQTHSYPSIHRHCGSTHRWHHNGLDKLLRCCIQTSRLGLDWGSVVGVVAAMVAVQMVLAVSVVVTVATVVIVAKEAVPEAASLPPRSSARQRSLVPQSHTQTRSHHSIHRHCGSKRPLHRSGPDRRRRFGMHPSSLCLGWGSVVGVVAAAAAAVLVAAMVVVVVVPEAASLPPRSSARQRSLVPQSHTQTRSHHSIHRHCGSKRPLHRSGPDRRRRFGMHPSSLCLGWGSLVGAAEAVAVTWSADPPNSGE